MYMITMFAAEAVAGALIAFAVAWAMVRGPKDSRFTMPWLAGLPAFIAVCLASGAIRYFTAVLGLYNTVELEGSGSWAVFALIIPFGLSLAVCLLIRNTVAKKPAPKPE